MNFSDVVKKLDLGALKKVGKQSMVRYNVWEKINSDAKEERIYMPSTGYLFDLILQGDLS